MMIQLYIDRTATDSDMFENVMFTAMYCATEPDNQIGKMTEDKMRSLLFVFSIFSKSRALTQSRAEPITENKA